MSERRSWRVSLAVEGKADRNALEAILSRLLASDDIEINVLQPDISAALGDQGPLGGGWSGVLRWCGQAAEEGQGSFANSVALQTCDLLAIHLDVDVADNSYSDGNMERFLGPVAADSLPCRRPCPPASDAADALANVVRLWLRVERLPEKAVLCLPAKNMDTWLLAALDPANKTFARGGWGCRGGANEQLQSLPAKRRPRGKNARDVVGELHKHWPRVCSQLPQAQRFHDDVAAAIGRDVL